MGRGLWFGLVIGLVALVGACKKDLFCEPCIQQKCSYFETANGNYCLPIKPKTAIIMKISKLSHCKFARAIPTTQIAERETGGKNKLIVTHEKVSNLTQQEARTLGQSPTLSSPPLLPVMQAVPTRIPTTATTTTAPIGPTAPPMTSPPPLPTPMPTILITTTDVSKSGNIEASKRDDDNVLTTQQSIVLESEITSATLDSYSHAFEIAKDHSSRSTSQSFIPPKSTMSSFYDDDVIASQSTTQSSMNIEFSLIMRNYTTDSLLALICHQYNVVNDVRRQAKRKQPLNGTILDTRFRKCISILRNSINNNTVFQIEQNDMEFNASNCIPPAIQPRYKCILLLLIVIKMIRVC